MIKSWLFALTICNLINIIVNPPKYHISPMAPSPCSLGYAGISTANQLIRFDDPDNIIESIFQKFIDLANKIPDIIKFNLYFLHPGSASIIEKFLKDVLLVFIPATSSSQTVIYSPQAVFLPNYYTFLFRLTPF